MHEPLLERIRELEKANRRWKTVGVLLAVVLAAILGSGGAFVGVFGFRALVQNQRALRAQEEALMQEAVARVQAEAARQQAERALQDLKEREKK